MMFSKVQQLAETAETDIYYDTYEVNFMLCKDIFMCLIHAINLPSFECGVGG